MATINTTDSEPEIQPSVNPTRSRQGSILHHQVDLRALDYTSKVDENLICPICQVALISPVTTTCDHTFCSDCLDKAYDTSQTCPIDRSPLELPNDVTRTHKLILNQLDGLLVRCPSQGCDKILARSMVQNHVEKYCGFALVSCPKPSCEKVIPRKDSTNGCLHFERYCEDCDHPVMVLDMDLHRESYCLKRHTNCEKCGEGILRIRQEDHLKTCPEELDSCQWRHLGCTYQSPRKDLHLHITMCNYKIVGPLVQTLQNQIEMLRTEIVSLSARDSIRERRIKFLETERLNTQVSEIPDISSLNMLGQSSSSGEYAPHDTRDQYLLSLLESQESKVDQISAGMTAMEAKQTMMLLNETMPIKESLTELRNAQGVLGMHVRWLMNFRMQEKRPGAGAVGSSSPGSGSKGEAGGTSSADVGSILAGQGKRRLSDSLRENITKL